MESELETAEAMVAFADQLVDLARSIRDNAIAARDELLEKIVPA